MDVLSVTGAELIAELDSTRALERMITIRPDVLICDIEMPIVSGSELIRLIRKSEIFKQCICSRYFGIAQWKRSIHVSGSQCIY